MYCHLLLLGKWFCVGKCSSYLYLSIIYQLLRVSMWKSGNSSSTAVRRVSTWRNSADDSLSYTKTNRFEVKLTNLLILLMLPHFAWPCQLGPRRVTMRAAPESGAAQLSGSKALFVKGFVSSWTDRFTDLGVSGYPWYDIRLLIYLHEVIVP